MVTEPEEHFRRDVEGRVIYHNWATHVQFTHMSVKQRVDLFAEEDKKYFDDGSETAR